MSHFLPAGVRRTLVGFTTLAGLLLSMAQSCDAGCGSSSGASRSAVAAPKVTVTPSETSSGARYFQDRQWGGADDARPTSTKRTSATCTPTSRATTRKTRSSSSSKDKQGNNGSAFDEGYDKGYDEGYDDGYDDARRKDTGRSKHDDG